MADILKHLGVKKIYIEKRNPSVGTKTSKDTGIICGYKDCKICVQLPMSFGLLQSTI